MLAKRSKTTCCTTPRLQVSAQSNVPTRNNSPARCVVGDTALNLKHTVDCVCIKQTLRCTTTCRRRDSSAFIKLCYLQPRHGTGYDVWSVHNHTNTACRPHCTMQTYGRASNTKKCSHKLPDIRTVSVNIFQIIANFFKYQEQASFRNNPEVWKSLE